MIQYRHPRPDEAAAFATMHVQCWREAYKDIVPAELLKTFDVSQRLARWQINLENFDRIVIGAFDGDVPVGFVMGGTPRDELFEGSDGQIEGLYVSASHYRLGIGRKLLIAIAGEWLKRDGRSLTLGVLAENKRARQFYEAMGGRLVKETVYNWSGYELPDCLYVFEDLKALIGKD